MAILPKEVQKKRCCCCTLPSRPSQAFVSGVRLPSFSPAGFALPTGVLKLIPVAASANSPPQPGRPAIASQPPPPPKLYCDNKIDQNSQPEPKMVLKPNNSQRIALHPSARAQAFFRLEPELGSQPFGNCSVVQRPKRPQIVQAAPSRKKSAPAFHRLWESG